MIPLTTRSHFSLMWGTASPKQLCRHAAALGYKRLALTDTDNLYGLWPFLNACRQTGIRPIVGAEVTDPNHPYRAVCLVENDRGYGNLCRLLTRRHLDDTFDLKQALPELSPGLTVLTGSASLAATWHAKKVRVAAAMPRRPLPPGHRLRRTAKELSIPLAAVPGSFFLAPEEVAVHRMLRAIDLNTALSCLKPTDAAPDDAWLAGPEIYRRRFAPCPEALAATETIAERLTFTGPSFGLVMPPWSHADGRDADSHLRAGSYAGARLRYGNELPEAVVKRLNYELRIITKMGFGTYFLVVQEIIQNSPRICGRGSGAASLVAYCLGITNVCPLKHNLYFERFLNPGRSDPPDIDVDFAWDERDDVQTAVLNKFQGRAAMVCNHVTFKPRMAVREMAKVLGLTDAEIGRVSKRMPWSWRNRGETGMLDALKQMPEMREQDFAPPWPEIMAMAQQIIGVPRYLSVHSGGVVITPEPIDRYVPVEQATKGVPIIQWEKDATETAGLVKIDLLGNRSLGVIRDAVKNVAENRLSFNESTWEPEDDFSTQEAVAQGKTMGCFYIESPSMRQLQQKAAVGDFEHMVIHSSIIRPAANEFIQEYVRRLHGGQWSPIHPLLADVLDETFGIMVYQEDVSRAAVAVAGFSHVDADGLRKIMSKKDKLRQLKDYYKQFQRGAAQRGVDAKTIESIWTMMMSFDGYSFCKPHSASYARVSFQAAYLKVHYPAEFMAAVITNQGGFYSTFAYVSEARRMGLTIHPPDVDGSEIQWTGQGNDIRVGLMSIKGLSLRTMQRIMDQRQQAPFAHSDDFLRRVRPDTTEGRSLIHAGALDRLRPGASRATLLWDLARWEKARAEKKERPFSLFGDDPLPQAPLLPQETEADRLQREYAVLGFLCDRHPMRLYRHTLSDRGIITAAELSRYQHQTVTIAGWPITAKQVRTKHGDAMEFVTFEDETGLLETTFFPKAYHRYCHMIGRGRPYLLTGKVEEDWGVCTLNVSKVTPLTGRKR